MGGKQISRSGCASTQAFGRAVRVFDPGFYGTAEAVPFRFVPPLDCGAVWGKQIPPLRYGMTNKAKANTEILASPE